MGTCMSLDQPPHLPQALEPVEEAPNVQANQYCNNKNNSKVGTTDEVSGVSVVDVDELRQNAGKGDVNIFTYSELRAATKNFRPDLILGEGGFGIVYKGIIDDNVRPAFPSTQVAVKVLNRDGLQGDREWLTEVYHLGQFSHPNLVKLIGYCCEDEHRLVVYEYMACGSLEKHLFRRICLTMPWSTRMRIASDAAKGLAFLHGATRPVIYRDFKTSNILLDSNYSAKLSDFGLAKEGPVGDQTHVSTRVMGTDGYAAPEYVMTGHLTARSDVYGFGVVLLEMLIGRRAMDKSRPSREQNLVEWARPFLVHNRKLQKLIDPRMEGQYCFTTAQKVANLAYQCLSQNPKGRPTMSQVVEILEVVQEQDDSEQGLPSQGWDCAAVTLYEAPKEAVNSNADENKSSLVARAEESRREANRVPSHRRRRAGLKTSSTGELSSMENDQGDSEQGLPSQRWDCAAVTLYEAPKEAVNGNADENKSSFIARAEESRREANRVHSHRRRRAGLKTSSMGELSSMLKEQDDSERGLPSQRWDCAAVTLYEAPKVAVDGNADENKSSFVARAEESRRESNRVRSHRRRRAGPMPTLKTSSIGEISSMEKESIKSPESDGPELHSRTSSLSPPENVNEESILR